MYVKGLTQPSRTLHQEPNYLTKHQGLADYPGKNQLLCVSGKWNNFDDAVCVVGKDIDHNKGGSYIEKYETIETVLNMYRNLVINDKSLYQYTAEPQNEREQDAILELLKIIAERSGVQYDKVVEIMKTLYWAYRNGRIRTSDALYPREAKLNNENRKPAGSGGITDNLETLVKWGVPIAIIGVVAFTVSKLYALNAFVKSGAVGVVADGTEVEANGEDE